MYVRYYRILQAFGSNIDFEQRLGIGWIVLEPDLAQIALMLMGICCADDKTEENAR